MEQSEDSGFFISPVTGIDEIIFKMKFDRKSDYCRVFETSTKHNHKYKISLSSNCIADIGTQLCQQQPILGK